MSWNEGDTAEHLTRLQGYFSTMSPAEYVGSDGADPEHGPWAAWCDDKVPGINGDFALFAWWHFCAALSAFVAPEGGAYPEYLQGDPDEPMAADAHERLASEIVHALRQVEAKLGAPLSLARRHREEDFWPESDDVNPGLEPIRRTAAYALWCWDQAILSLYNGDAASSASAVAYGVDATRMAEEYVSTVMGRSDSPMRAARRNFAQQGIAAKLARDPKQAEKRFVRECWESWQAEPTRYKTKAAFARDMIEKCAHLTSTNQIEEWCRNWERERKST